MIHKAIFRYIDKIKLSGSLWRILMEGRYFTRSFLARPCYINREVKSELLFFAYISLSIIIPRASITIFALTFSDGADTFQYQNTEEIALG